MIEMRPMIASTRVSIRPIKMSYVPFQHGEFLRAFVYKTMKPLWNSLHDSNAPKPFSINPIQSPPGMKKERKTFVVPPHVHGYFDIVVFGKDMGKALKRFSELNRKTIQIGQYRFKIVSTNTKYLPEETLNSSQAKFSKLEMTFKTPLFFLNEGYGKELRMHELSLEKIMRTPFRIYNMVSDQKISPDDFKKACEPIRLLDQQSSLTAIRFPVHNDDKQIIYTGHKGRLVFQGKINGTISKLVKIANWTNVGHGRTIGLGKIHARLS